MKVNLFGLPKELLHSILCYFSVKELLYPVMQVNKKLYNEAGEGPIMAYAFFNQIKVPFSYGGQEFSSLSPDDKNKIIKEVLWASGTNERLNVCAYFTDGGFDGNDSTYFISNIYADNPPHLYCSKRGYNVNVKAICCEKLPQNPADLTDLSKYKIAKDEYISYEYPEDTYVYPLKSMVSKNDPQANKNFAIMKYHDLNRNLTGYTCFLQSFALFISMEEIDANHPLIKLFDGIDKFEKMDKLGFEFMSLQDTEGNKIVEFNLSNPKNIEATFQKHIPKGKINGVYPFIWGEVNKTNSNYLNIIQRIGFRYLLLKLIDSFKANPAEGNIDCYTISISGNYVRLKTSNEE